MTRTQEVRTEPSPINFRGLGRNALLIMTLACAVPFSGHTQEQQPASQSSSQSGTSGGNFMTPDTANHQQLAAAQEEDETAVYKTSPSVRAIGIFHLAPKSASVAFEFMNFALLAAIVIFYIAKAAPKAFRARQKGIDQQLGEARIAANEAKERLHAVEERLSRLDEEIAGFRKQSEQDALNDEQRIKQSIEEERKKIIASAEQEIGTASATAERSLRKFAAELAVNRALGRLSLNELEDRALVQNFAADLHPGRN